jgi:5-hydroxyisourate hydrolase-like protein (transthyretin family)
MKFLAICVALLLQSVAQAPAATIEGAVESDNGQPLAGAQVSLSSAGGLTRVTIPPVLTDSAGSFRFSNLDAGTYRVAASNNGYARREFGQRADDTPGAPIALKAGDAQRGLTIRLTQAGNVSGFLHRQNGRPAPGVTVQLVRRNWEANGRVSVTSVLSAKSDDRGAYRFYWVTPGRYYVVAGSPGFGIASLNSTNNNEVVETYAYTFYPGNMDFEKAVAIEVKPGAEVEGIDLALAQAPLLRIRAQIVDPKTGKPPAQATGYISYWTPNGGGGQGGGDTYNPQTGLLQFTRLVPGVYEITISAYDGPGVPTTTMNRAAPGASAGARVAITDRDVDLGVLTLESPAVITGRLRVEGDALDAGPRSNLQIMLTSAASSVASIMQPNLQPIAARVQADGNLTANFPYASARISATGLPASYYIREAKLNGADALTSFAGVTASSTLEVVLVSTGVQLDGVVRDTQSRPLPGALAVLVPQSDRSRTELFKQAITDQNGRFNLTGVAPGDYKLFSWERLARYSYFDPDVLREYEEKGTPVRVSETSREAVELRAIPTN